MIEQAIAAVSKLSEKANAAQILRCELEPKSSYYLVHEGRCERVKAAPPERAHEVQDLGGLVGCTKRLASPLRPATVWVSRSAVVALLDDGDRRDRARLPLAASAQMKMLAHWGGEPKWLAQVEVVRVLRNVFAKSVKGSDLVGVFRRLKFSVNGGGESVVEHGKSSVGRAIEQKVTGASAIPEDVTFREPCFDGEALGLGAVVPCNVEIDVRTEKIAFVPLAGAVEEAWRRAEEAILERVVGLVADAPHVHVYLGTP